jgi:hypothetical protein
MGFSKQGGAQPQQNMYGGGMNAGFGGMSGVAGFGGAYDQQYGQ